MRAIAATLGLLLISLPLAAQKDKPEPLTETQQDQIAETGIDPVVRVGLYIKFLDEHSDTIKGLIPRAHTEALSAAGLRLQRRPIDGDGNAGVERLGTGKSYIIHGRPIAK